MGNGISPHIAVPIHRIDSLAEGTHGKWPVNKSLPSYHDNPLHGGLCSGEMGSLCLVMGCPRHCGRAQN